MAFFSSVHRVVALSKIVPCMSACHVINHRTTQVIVRSCSCTICTPTHTNTNQHTRTRTQTHTTTWIAVFAFILRKAEGTPNLRGNDPRSQNLKHWRHVKKLGQWKGQEYENDGGKADLINREDD
jgi:hypothetical protein